MPYSGSGFTLPPEDYFSPPPVYKEPFTYSQPAAAAPGNFAAPSMDGGGGGAPRSFRAPSAPGPGSPAPGSRGSSFSAARAGVPHGYSAYAWGQHMGRMFAKKRLKDFLDGEGHKFPMPPR